MRSVVIFNNKVNKLCLWIIKRYLTKAGEHPVFIDLDKYPLTRLYSFYCPLSVYVLADAINNDLIKEILDSAHYLTQITNTIEDINLTKIICNTRVKIIVNTRTELSEAMWAYFFKDEEEPYFFKESLLDENWLAYDEAMSNRLINKENKIVKLRKRSYRGKEI